MTAALPIEAMTIGAGPGTAGMRQLQVRAIRLEAHDILSFELADPEGAELPPVEAGAHVDVHLPGEFVRPYSLAGDPNDRSRWLLGVLREAVGRGGSRALHDSVRVGSLLTVGTPRNAFPLAAGASRSILLGGGIGITPLKAMAHALTARGAPVELHYCARSPRHAAFGEALRALLPPEHLHLHFDGGDPARGLDIAALLREPSAGVHVYFCGPAGFMRACTEATRHWPADQVHCEHFKAPETACATAPCAEGQVLRLQKSGREIALPGGVSVVDALQAQGVEVPTSCLSGLCGACKVPYLSGEVEHHDFILSPEEQAVCLTACVSRPKGSVLVLDL